MMAKANECLLSTRTNGPQSRECSLRYSGTYGPRYSRARWALLMASCSKPCCCASTCVLVATRRDAGDREYAVAFFRRVARHLPAQARYLDRMGVYQA